MTDKPISSDELAGLLDDDRGDMTALCSPDGVILFISPACTSMTGWLPTALVGQAIDAFVHPEDLAGVVAARAAVLSSPPAVVSTFRFRCEDGGYLWTEGVVKRVVHPRNPDASVVMANIRGIAERQAVATLLERQANTDLLTGIASRTVFMDRVDHALRRLQQLPSVLALIYLDLDRFKVINDSLGHELGDRLLAAVAQRAGATLRPADTLARLGGDEFVILVEDLSDPVEATDLGRRVCADMGRPFELDGETIVCTASAGVVTTTTSDANHGAARLLQDAAIALHRAKDQGRNRAQVFDEHLRAVAVSRLETERMIRGALADDRVVVHYQPIIDLSTGDCVNAEALVRIRDGDPVTLPGAFLDVAEETGLLVSIDEHVLARATAQAATWTHDPDAARFGGISINVTARHLADPSFVTALAATLGDHHLSDGSLLLEVTERALMEASDSTLESIHAIRALGVPVGLDDFGTGYSSLAYLRQFPLDFVKVDQSFVSHICDSRRDGAIVAAIVDLAHALDLVVIAEGVETEDQLAALVTMGCDQAQGFLIGHPAEPSTLRSLCRKCRT